MVFSTVREEPEPVKEAVVEKQPEAEDLNIPKKPVKREIELTPAKKEQEEKTPIPWEVTDPKPPVIRSGHMENRRTGDAGRREL